MTAKDYHIVAGFVLVAEAGLDDDGFRDAHDDQTDAQADRENPPHDLDGFGKFILQKVCHIVKQQNPRKAQAHKAGETVT